MLCRQGPGTKGIRVATTYLVTVAWMWAIATISPGPNFLTIAQLAASRSRTVAMAAVAGTGLATIVWGVAGVAGVQALFAAAPWAYLALKIGGAAYLVYRGVFMIIRSSARTDRIGQPSDRTKPISQVKAFMLGLSTGLANPRSALSVASVFLVALPGRPTPGLALAAIATMVAVSVAWYVLVAVLFTTGPVVRSYHRIGRWIDRAAGGMLIFLGVKLATERT